MLRRTDPGAQLHWPSGESQRLRHTGDHYASSQVSQQVGKRWKSVGLLCGRLLRGPSL